MFDPVLSELPNKGKYDSYYPSNHIFRVNFQENMTHIILSPMGVNVLGGK